MLDFTNNTFDDTPSSQATKPAAPHVEKQRASWT
jgi:hypothetical protein